ncbi:MAG: DUF2634 domain-containing protein [Eubacterium sp.]|nr:DUF2634 domain-containing protein [Eubacterium sp.]
MIPETSGLIESEEIVFEEPSSKTYLIDFDQKCLRLSFDEGDSNGFIDDLKAMEQAVFCMLNTERYEHLIYSWDYGSELQDIIGMDTDIVLSEIERRVTETLMEDSRILSVDDFDFETNKKEVVCTFSVSTIYGDLEMKQEVEF